MSLKINRYLVNQMMPRMIAALLVTLVILLIERLLRLLDLLTGKGADIGPLLTLMLNLLPHYMGLALPAAFCIAVLGTLSAMSKSNEIDALEAAGHSLRRIGAPFILCGLVLSLVSVALFGFIQPYSRYAFSEIRYAISNSGWKGRVEQGVFIDLSEGMTLSAHDIDASGRYLRDVFLLREDELGETAITAKEGLVVPDKTGASVRLVLFDGHAYRPDGNTLVFEELQINREFELSKTPFRPRGESARELTIIELWQELERTGGGADAALFEVQLHGRLVRALSLIGIAMIAVPMSVSRKRASGWQRIAVAVAVLAVYDNLIKFVSSMAELGRVDPVVGLWALFGAFMAISTWLYVSTPGIGARSPFLILYRTIGRVRG